MVIAFLVVNYLLVTMFLATRPRVPDLVAYALIVPFNALVFSVAASFGLNDTLVAALVGAAVIARFRGSMVSAGTFLALAALLKYYPALLVPFFALDRRRWSLRVVWAFAATGAAGVAVTLAMWGWGFLTPIQSGVDRSPKLLSVLSSITRLGVDGTGLAWLIDANAWFVLASVAAAAYIAYAARLHWLQAATTASLVFLVVYKVGHPQFYLFWLFLLVGLLIEGSRTSRMLVYCSLPYVIFLSLFQFGYELITDGYMSVAGGVRTYVGLFAFGLAVATLAGFWYLRTSRWMPQPGRSPGRTAPLAGSDIRPDSAPVSFDVEQHPRQDTRPPTP